MIEKQSYQEPFSEVDKRKDDEMEIDLMAIFYKIITVRGVCLLYTSDAADE